jgi:hypothetical protein
LLFIPGTMNFGDARYPSISRILVSTWDSVVNGRINWGIPKDRANFDWVHADDSDRWCVTDNGRELCAVEFSAPVGMRLPLRSAWTPGGFATLAQRLDGRTYYCRPAATGRARLCRVRHWHFAADLFPDLSQSTVLAALRIEDFRMTFPVARIVG